MKFFRTISALLLIIALAFSGAAFAADPGDLADATYDGMLWLESMQNTDGSWGDFYPDDLARTGLALLKFETHALNDPEYRSPFHQNYPFKQNVVDGLDYLLASAAQVTIGPQPAGDPDSNGNGLGICLAYGAYHEIYVTSIGLMAIVASGDPTREVTTGPLSGETYYDVAQDMVDYLAWGQTDLASPASVFSGGWNYYAMDDDSRRSDNSISGYAAMGLAFAEHPVYGFECDIPAFVKDELEKWVNYIQNASGGSGYSDPEDWVNLLKTGNLLQQMAFIGIPISDARVVAALGYIQNNWNNPSQDPGWKDGPTVSNYQATFTLMKGLQAYGVETLTVGGDPAFDWFNDIADELLAEQLVSPDPYADAWPICTWDYEGNHVLSTTWALLTLQKVAPPPPIRPIDINIKPGSFPNAVNPKPVGVLPIAILGTEDFDVMTVDCTSIFLTMEGEVVELEPLRCNYEDVESDPPELDPDGYMDIIMHFDMEAILDLIGSDAEGEIELMIIGEDMDGYAFMGTDVIWIVPKTK